MHYPREALTERFHDGEPIRVEFSPVTDFSSITCRFQKGCTCRSFCCFLHLRPIPEDLQLRLFGRYKKPCRFPSKSRSPNSNAGSGQDFERENGDVWDTERGNTHEHRPHEESKLATCPSNYSKSALFRNDDTCPAISPTLLLQNLYESPALSAPLGRDGRPSIKLSSYNVQQHFEVFIEDIFNILNVYGKIFFLGVCDNLTDDMVGNVYVRFSNVQNAEDALEDLAGWLYKGKPISVKF